MKNQITIISIIFIFLLVSLLAGCTSLIAETENSEGTLGERAGSVSGFVVNQKKEDAPNIMILNDFEDESELEFVFLDNQDRFENDRSSFKIDSSEKISGSSSLKLEYDILKNHDFYIDLDFKEGSVLATPADWSKYESLNFWMLSDGKGGILRVLIIDQDEDKWSVYDYDVLNYNKWVRVSIPFSIMNEKDYCSDTCGAGLKDLEGILEYRFIIEKDYADQKQEGRYLYIDQIYLK